jgi:hypothetical protein
MAGAASYVVANRLAPPGVPALASILLACVVTVGTYAAVLSITGFFRPGELRLIRAMGARLLAGRAPLKFSREDAQVEMAGEIVDSGPETPAAGLDADSPADGARGVSPDSQSPRR